MFDRLFNRKKNNGIGRTVKIGDPEPQKERGNNMDNIIPSKSAVVASTTVVRKKQPGQKIDIEILSIGKNMDTNANTNTMIIQCPNESVLNRVKNMITRYGRKTTTSYISDRLTMDIYINISLSPDVVDPHIYRGNKYLSIVYELSEDGVCYGINRFPDAILVTVGETFDKPKLTIGQLFGGVM